MRMRTSLGRIPVLFFHSEGLGQDGEPRVQTGSCRCLYQLLRYCIVHTDVRHM